MSVCFNKNPKILTLRTFLDTKTLKPHIEVISTSHTTQGSYLVLKNMAPNPWGLSCGGRFVLLEEIVSYHKLSNV